MSRGKEFVKYALRRIKNDSGFRADLRKADSHTTEKRAWEHLASWCNLEIKNERLPFLIIAAAISRSKPIKDGELSIGRALAVRTGNQSDSSKIRFRRLLSCDTTEETCTSLRQLLSFLSNVNINYGLLLDELLWFEKSKEETHRKWAMDFYNFKR